MRRRVSHADQRYGTSADPKRRNRRARIIKGWVMTITAMEAPMTRGNVRLRSGHGLSLSDAAGVEVTSLKGRVWLTMEGDLRDIDLQKGTAYTIERNGLTLVNAFEPSLVHVRFPHRRIPQWRVWVT